MIFGVLFSFLPLLAIGGIIAAIVAATRRSGDGDEAEPRIGSVRRLFLYGLAFIALMLAATGLSLLLGGLFDAAGGESVIAESKTALALGLSLTLVGGGAISMPLRSGASAIPAKPRRVPHVEAGAHARMWGTAAHTPARPGVRTARQIGLI